MSSVATVPAAFVGGGESKISRNESSVSVTAVVVAFSVPNTSSRKSSSEVAFLVASESTSLALFDASVLAGVEKEKRSSNSSSEDMVAIYLWSSTTY